MSWTGRQIRKATNAPRDRAWQAMRILRRFTVPQVCAAAEIHRVSLMRYIMGLRRTGYVIKVATKCGPRHEPAAYQLIRDTGPYRPWLQMDGRVYDRNTATEWHPHEVDQ